MALHLILGGSGTGKSNDVYERILAQSLKRPDQLYYVIVPEQFTLQTQQELVRRQKNHGLMNIDVVSFQRLAYRVFDELGIRGLTILEDVGKSFVLRKLAEEKGEELKSLRGSIKKCGYLAELKSIICELGQYRIGPEKLQELSDDESLPTAFRLRIGDIALLYDSFLAYIRDTYVTAEELLEVLAREVGRSELLQGSCIVLDGFYGFTPVQYEVIGRLLSCASDVYVTVTMDAREKPYVRKGYEELFDSGKQMIAALTHLAEGAGVPVADPVFHVHTEMTRFSHAKMLEQLEQNLFREEAVPFDGAESIRLTSLPNPRAEMICVAGEVARLVREKGCRYREIAVVCGDMERYQDAARQIFDDYGIPYFIDRKNTILYQPMTELIKAALLVAERDFTYESVMAYLRSGLSGFTREEADLFENYILANRIRGKHRYEQAWVRRNGIAEEAELTKVNEMRTEILSRFQEGYTIWRGKNTTVQEKTVALYRFLTDHRVQEQLKEREIRQEAAGNLSKSKEYAQIYRIVMDLLNKLVLLLGEEKLPPSEYRGILEAGFYETSMGVIPPSYDQVLVGDIERSRLPQIRFLFLVGANDGVIPKAEGTGGLITEREREYFAAHELTLAPGAREKAFLQRFHLYLTLTKPSEYLYVSWSRTDSDGREARRSYLVTALQHLFPALSVNTAGSAYADLDLPMEQNAGALSDEIATEKSSLPLLLAGIREAGEGRETKAFPALLHWYLSRQDLGGAMERLLDAAFYHYESQDLKQAVTHELYGQELMGSITRLEQFSACAYAHFLKFGLKLSERQVGEFAPVDMGSLFHDAIERYSVKMEQAGYHWKDVPADVMDALIAKAVTETVEKDGYLLFTDARSAYTIQRISRIVKKTIEMITVQVERSHFMPEGYEVSFSFADDPKAVNFILDRGEKMRLIGRIDRLDTQKSENTVYVKVIDYKSGQKEFEPDKLACGLQLQLVVYMNAAVELMKRKYKDCKVLPGGMYYYHIDDPIIETGMETSEDEIKEKVYDKQKLKGIGIPLGDGSVTKSSEKAGSEDLKLLSDFASFQIASIGQAIYDGEITVNPYQTKKMDSCAYCPYHDVCTFDPSLPGFQARSLPDEGEQEALYQQMREEKKNGNDIHDGSAEGH